MGCCCPACCLCCFSGQLCLNVRRHLTHTHTLSLPLSLSLCLASWFLVAASETDTSCLLLSLLVFSSRLFFFVDVVRDFPSDFPFSMMFFSLHFVLLASKRLGLGPSTPSLFYSASFFPTTRRTFVTHNVSTTLAARLFGLGWRAQSRANADDAFFFCALLLC